jgi:hypothetical protein
MTEAARVLGRLWPRAAPAVHRAGADASLAAWHQVFDPVNRFGWIMVNSSGFPRQFSIPGGSGRPADLPRGQPAAVSIIHSFSAVDPSDPSTLAGRWLENGAFVYYGAMNEPYLHAFRPPKLVAELVAAELPLSAALRQGEHELFGRPWRLVYLGDPLYRFYALGSHARQDRIAPRAWRPLASIHGGRPIEEVTARVRPLDSGADESTRLQWCLTAAISALCQAQGSGKPGDSSARSPSGATDLRSILIKIDRPQLQPRLRPVLDELVTDTLLNAGDEEQLLEWLLQIPPAECSPRVWQAIETIAMSRLVSLAGSRSVTPALDLWDELIRRPWLAGSEFPAQLTQRLAALVDSNPRGSQDLYRERLIQSARFLALNPERYPHAALVKDELKRLETSPARGSDGTGP